MGGRDLGPDNRRKAAGAALTPALQPVVREIHPELCFTTAVSAPMAHAKKARRPGRAHTRPRGPGVPRASPAVRPRLDDLLDACIACWTARCIADGHATTLPAEPPTDARGLRIECLGRSAACSRRGSSRAGTTTLGA